MRYKFFPSVRPKSVRLLVLGVDFVDVAGTDRRVLVADPLVRTLQLDTHNEFNTLHCIQHRQNLPSSLKLISEIATSVIKR